MLGSQSQGGSESNATAHMQKSCVLENAVTRARTQYDVIIQTQSSQHVFLKSYFSRVYGKAGNGAFWKYCTLEAASKQFSFQWLWTALLCKMNIQKKIFLFSCQWGLKYWSRYFRCRPANIWSFSRLTVHIPNYFWHLYSEPPSACPLWSIN